MDETRILPTEGAKPAGPDDPGIRAALTGLPRMTAPADLWPRIRRSLAAETVRLTRRHARVARLTRVLAPLAAALILALGVLVRPRTAAPPTPGPLQPVVRQPIDAPPVAILADLNAVIADHAQLTNEPFVAGDDLLLAEWSFPADVTRAGHPQ